MAKDPAFLFYSKDWIEGTAEMTCSEKGVYIDLLAHQHQKGSLPLETKRLAKIVGMTEDEFMPIWGHVSQKFAEENGRLVNKKLTEVITERVDRGVKNKIISVLGICVRTAKFPIEVKNWAKTGFIVSDYIGVDEPKLTESITEWFTKRCTERLTKALEDGNGNEDGNAIVFNNTSKQEKEMPSNPHLIIPKMAAVWVAKNKSYPIDNNVDYPALSSIGKKIAKMKGWDEREILNGKMNETIVSWTKIVDFIAGNEFFRKLELQMIDKRWAGLCQTMTAESNPKEIQKEKTVKIKLK
jgi:uncharacterized protein YdaU (DUF1376 family)